MHTKNLRSLFVGVFAMCVYALVASAKTPPMSQYFRYQSPVTTGEQLVLDPLIVKGSRTALHPVSEKLANALNKRLPTAPDEMILAFGMKLYLVNDLEDDFLDDLLSDTTMPASSDFIRELKGGMQVNLPYTDVPMTVYVKSGLMWKINYQWSLIAPYAKGRNIGLAFRYNMLR